MFTPNMNGDVSMSHSSSDAVNTPTTPSCQLDSIKNAMDLGSPLNILKKNLFRLIKFFSASHNAFWVYFIHSRVAKHAIVE